MAQMLFTAPTPYVRGFMRSIQVQSQREEYTQHSAVTTFDQETCITSVCALTQGAIGSEARLSL